eukprot:6399922-Prymnesium_polylepis.2
MARTGVCVREWASSASQPPGRTHDTMPRAVAARGRAWRRARAPVLAAARRELVSIAEPPAVRVALQRRLKVGGLIASEYCTGDRPVAELRVWRVRVADGPAARAVRLAAADCGGVHRLVTAH